MAAPMSSMEKDFDRVNIKNYVPQKYSGGTKKVAPVVPPKPANYVNETYGLPNPTTVSYCYPKDNCIPCPDNSKHSQKSKIHENSTSKQYSNDDFQNYPVTQSPPEVYTYTPSDLLPPPPPEFLSYSPPENQSFPPPPEDLMPPPLPSSAYGAAASVGKPQQTYPGPEYKPTSSVKYPPANSPYHQALAKAGNLPRGNDEPIYQTTGSLQRGSNHPGPKSSGYSLPGGYGSPSNKKFVPASSNQPITHPDRSGQEAEVDALTNLLVKSMDTLNEIESCAKCGDRIVGESNGCTAMDQVFHITCFVCCVCGIQLKGKPFYAMEGKPYCEDDYMNTLEKCSVCQKPIMDRILRATGKPYHPQCFTCVACNKSLDGIPFTVDAANQVYCIEDFHKKFAPRCCVCKQPIMPEPGQEETVRIVAMDKSFHINCYKCEDCGLVLSSEADGRGCYPLDDHILCKSCNAKRCQAMSTRMSTEL